MKTNTLIKFAAVCIAISTIFSCVNDDDFNVPENLGNQESKALLALQELIKTPNNGYNLVTIQNLKERFSKNKYQPLKIETNDVVKGYVTSSDASGNFYKEFYMAETNEEGQLSNGVKVVLNQTDTYNKFNIGREVYINLKDLYLGETNQGDKVLAIGGKIDDKNEIDPISTKQAEKVVLRSKNTQELQPLAVKLSQITKDHVGVLVSVDNAQFAENIVGLPYVDPLDDYDSQRRIESCETNSITSFTLETSTFASFRNEPLPAKNGTITGLITYDYDGKNLVMVLNTTNDVVFNQDRCNVSSGGDALFFDSFSEKNLDKWTVYDVKGNQSWYYNKYGNPDDSATMSGYDKAAKKSVENEDWLITKAIDLSGVKTGSKVELTFDNDIKFTGPQMEVYMATDYKGGNPNTDGTWSALTANWDPNTKDFNTWVNSGAIDVSAAVGGNLFIAFKYTSTASKSATYEIDNVTVNVVK